MSTDPIHDAGTAIAAAGSFRSLAARFLKRVGTDLHTSPARAAENVGGLIASITNLTLAVELYLKAIRIVLSIPALKTHNLADLYDGLPADLKELIEQHYSEFEDPPKDEALLFNLAVSVGPMADHELEEAAQGHEDALENRSFSAVLARNSSAFVTWRYMHEGGSPSEVRLYTYEFYDLHRVAETLKECATHLFDKRQAGDYLDA